jgi:predicted amidophosphoribosyltransferase
MASLKMPLYTVRTQKKVWDRVHGVYSDYMNSYYERRIREICHGVKDRDSIAVLEMADYFLNLEIVKTDSILVPAPQHEGYAIYTRQIADILSRETGCKIEDVLISHPRKTLYEQKMANNIGIVQFELTKSIKGSDIFFLDNVIDTGTTFFEANKLLNGRLKPLVYAKTNKLKAEGTIEWIDKQVTEGINCQ